MKEIICIVCPVGCRLKVDEEKDFKVTGNACARGEKYGREELQNPSRVLTSTVRMLGGRYRRLPVRTDAPIPKAKLFEAMEEIRRQEVRSPVHAGEVLVEDLAGTGIRLISVRDM